MSGANLATDLRPEVLELATGLGLDPDRGPIRRWGVPLAEVTQEQAAELLTALQERQAAAPPPAAPDRETAWAAGVLWRAHAAYLAKREAVPDFTAEQLAAALATGPEVDEVDAPTCAREGAHADGVFDESPCRGERRR